MRRISLAHLALILLLSACTPENREAAAPAAPGGAGGGHPPRVSCRFVSVFGLRAGCADDWEAAKSQPRIKPAMPARIDRATVSSIAISRTTRSL